MCRSNLSPIACAFLSTSLHSARIRLKVRQLADDPASLAKNILPMKGGVGLFRLRVGNWRVVYTETLVIVSVIRIGPRGDVYD